MGLAAATQLSAKGANLILVSRSAAKLEEAIKSVKVCVCTPALPPQRAIADSLLSFSP